MKDFGQDGRINEMKRFGCVISDARDVSAPISFQQSTEHIHF